MRRTLPKLMLLAVSAVQPLGCHARQASLPARDALAEAPTAAEEANVASAPSATVQAENANVAAAEKAGSGSAQALPAPGAAPAAVQPAGSTTQASGRDMLDIEGHLTLQVSNVQRALEALHDLTARSGGVVTEERVDSSSEYAAARVTLRVPSASATSVFDAMDGLGRQLERNVTARDVGKEFYDATLRLSSLEATLHRYEQILAQATNVDEILRVEQELGRIRAEIEQVKGNLRWLSDRVARATIHVSLREQPPRIAASAEPDVKFFLGLRATGLSEFGQHRDGVLVGGGFGLRFSRALSLDMDLLKRPASDERGVDALLVSLGGETRSDLLPERRFLNPYLGWRAGYGRLESDNQGLLGATVGLELYHGHYFGLDLEARNYLAFGGPRGAHYLLSPALAASIAF